jgi:hypothetical protein
MMEGKVYLDVNNSVIIDGVCMNNGNQYCSLHYACDCCPYNYDQEVIERLQIGL